MPDQVQEEHGAKSAVRKRRERRKNEITDIAAKLFAARGYHATSIQDLSDATGLQRGALYHYIDSKKDLLYRIHERFIDPILAEAREIQSRALPPDEELRAYAHVLMRNVQNYRDQVTVFLHEWKAMQDDESWEAVRESRREFESILQRAIERGVAEGKLRTDEPRLTTLAFLGMINYSYQWFSPHGRLEPDAIADHFADVFLDGVRA